MEISRKRSDQITVPGTTSKSMGKRLSCREVSESVERVWGRRMPPRLEIQSNPCFPPYGKQLLESSSQEARQTRLCPGLASVLAAGNGECWSLNNEIGSLGDTVVSAILPWKI